MVGPSKALQICYLLKVHLGENRKAWPVPRTGPSLLCCSGLSSVWLPAIHLFRQENSLHIQALLDTCLISSFFNRPGVKSQRREILLWSGSPQKLRAARRNSVSFLALPSSVRSVVIPLLWGKNYFRRCSHILAWQTVTVNRLVRNAFLKE